MNKIFIQAFFVIILFGCTPYNSYEDFNERVGVTKVTFKDNVEE